MPPKKPYAATLYGADGKPLGEAPDSPDELKRIIMSGQAGFAQGSRVNMRKPDGSVVSLPAEPQNVLQALEAGYQVETSAARDERLLQEEYGGTMGQVGAAAHGAASAVSFGLVDVAGAALGGDEYTETVKKLKQANPDAHMGGAITGLTASFFLPGGQAKAASTLGKLTKLPRGVAKIGRSVEQATLKALGGPQGGMVRQALAKGTSMGAGTGAEGALYGAGQWLSESALGETDATAENLLSHMGTGAMWGGAAGGALGSTGEVLRRGLGAGKDMFKRSAKGVVKMYEKATGNKAHPELAGVLEGAMVKPIPGWGAKMYGAAYGLEPEGIAVLTQRGAAGRRARELATQAKNTRDVPIRSMSEKRDTLEGLMDEVQDNISGLNKIKNMKAIDTPFDDLAVTQEAQAIIREGGDAVEAMLKEADDIAGATYTGTGRTGLKQARRLLRKHGKKIDDILEGGGGARELHGEVDSLKRGLQKAQDKLANAAKKDPLAKEVWDRIEEYQERFRQHLMGEKTYGLVGTTQRELNAPWSRKIGRDKTPMGRQWGEKVGAEGWKPKYATNRKTMERMVNDMGRARNDLMEDHFLSQIDDSLELMKVARDRLPKMPSALKKKITDAEDIAKALRKEFLATKEAVTLQNQMGDIAQKSSQLQSLLPAGAGVGFGYLLGGEEGAALGLGLSVFTNPGRYVQMRAALDRMVSTSEIGVLKSLKSYVRKATGKIKPAARGMVAPASLSVLKRGNWGDKRTKDKNRYQAYERRVGELTDFITNPEKSISRMDERIAAVSDVAPNIAASMKAKAAQAARYLYDRAPKPIDRGTLLSGKWKPPAMELAKFERIAAVAAEGPKRMLESLNAGNLTLEEVKAVRELYPETYNKIVTTLAEQIPDLRDKLPYKERVQLSVLFDLPVDATMTPGFLAAMEMVKASAAAPAPMPARQPRSKVGDYKDVSVDKASMTGTQGLEMRKLA